MFENFSGKFNFSAEEFYCLAEVSNFRRNGKRSAEDLDFRLKF